MIKRLLACLLLLSAVASAAQSDWPMFGHDLNRTSFISLNATFASANLTLKWSYATNASIRSSAAASDLDGDGRLEVLFPSGSTLYALSSDGKALWAFTVNSTIHSSPAVGDIDGDGIKDVAFGADNGLLYVLGGGGTLKWAFATGGPVTVSPALADLNQDGKLEIFFGSWDEKFYALDYDSRVIWEYNAGEKIESSAAIADINRDNKSEIIFGCDNNLLYVLSNPPHKLWMYQVNGNIVSTPVASDINRDGKVDVVFGTEDGMAYALKYTLSGEGTRDEKSLLQPLWNYIAGGAINGVAVGNLQGNSSSKPEVVVVSDDKTVYLLNYTGGRLMRYTVSKPIRSRPLLADLNGDGTPEIVFGSDDRSLYAINASGSMLWAYKIESIVRASPIAADLTGGGNADVIVGCDDGTLYVFHSSLAGGKELADSLYEEALDYYTLNEIDVSREYAARAKSIYMNLSYMDGVEKTGRLLDKISALDYCVSAQQAYDNGNLEAAIELATESDKIYYELDLGNVSVCSSLLSRSNADLYVMEALFFYEDEAYNESEAYATEALRLYSELNNSEGVGEAEDLLNRTELAFAARQFHERAVEYYEKGSFDLASNYNEEAMTFYGRLGHEAGINRSLILEARIKAASKMVEAQSSFGGGRYAEANYRAAEAYVLYGEAGDVDGMDSALALLDSTGQYAEGMALLNLSLQYYANDSMTEASYYANKALDVCSAVNYSECVDGANIVLADFQPSSPGLPMPCIAFPIVLAFFVVSAAAVVLWRRRSMAGK